MALYNYKWYPWLVTGLCMLTVTASNGMLNSGLSVYDESLLKEFGWSVGALKLRDSLTFWSGSLLVLPAGWLIDRYGFKPFLLTGLAVLSVGYFTYGYIQNIAHVYALHIVFGLVIAMAGNMAGIVTATNWVPEGQRGLAVGLVIAGTSLGGIVIPQVASRLNLQLGWRSGMQMEIVLPLALILLMALLLKNKVKSVQLSGNEAIQTGMTFKEVLRQPAFYIVALSGALTYYAILALFSHLFLYMRSLSYPPVQAAGAISTLATAALFGKLFFGWLADRSNPFVLIRVLMLLMFAGLLGVSQAPAYIWWFLPLTGLGWGGLHTLYNFILIRLFGLREAGKINGFVSLAEAIGGGLGIALTGYVHDWAGGYGTALGLAAILLGLASATIFVLKPPKVL
jgi:MFS family permease